MTDEVQVLKLGGSALTRKSGFCEANLAKVKEWCDFLAKEYRRSSTKRILVLGGGSFGNQIPVRYGFAHPSRHGSFQKADLFRMTEGMFGWAVLFAKELADAGVPPYPIQASAVIYRSRSGVECYLRALERAMASGMVPIITGDLVWGEEGFEIFSSDLVATLCAIELRATCVDMVTDVEGIYPPGCGEVWPCVTSDNYDDVLGWCGSSGSPDITGGMRLKVTALGQAAAQGISGWLGTAADYIWQHSRPRAEWRRGTRFDPWRHA